MCCLQLLQQCIPAVRTAPVSTGRQQEIILNTEELQANTSHEQTFA